MKSELDELNLKHDIQFPGMANLPYRVVYNGRSLMSICSDADKVVVALPPEIPDGRHTYFQDYERESKSIQFMVYASNRHHALTAELKKAEAELSSLRKQGTFDDGSGVSLISGERARQLSIEGWTPEHDDNWDLGQISRAAISYATRAFYQIYSSGKVIIDSPLGWPWDIAWFKPSLDPIRNLVKAGALIAAEIDRLGRTSGGETK